MNEIQYPYELQTWGGFYNTQWLELHGKKEGFYFFKTEEEMNEMIDELKALERKYPLAKYLMIATKKRKRYNKIHLEFIATQRDQKINEILNG